MRGEVNEAEFSVPRRPVDGKGAQVVGVHSGRGVFVSPSATRLGLVSLE
jgi:hypothetical protein